MVTAGEFGKLETRVGKLEAEIGVAGGIVGRRLCDERERRVMDAVDRLNSTHERLEEQIQMARKEAKENTERVSKEVANKRKRDAAMLVSIVVLVLGSLIKFLFDHVSKGG